MNQQEPDSWLYKIRPKMHHECKIRGHHIPITMVYQKV